MTSEFTEGSNCCERGESEVSQPEDKMFDLIMALMELLRDIENNDGKMEEIHRKRYGQLLTKFNPPNAKE